MFRRPFLNSANDCSVNQASEHDFTSDSDQIIESEIFAKSSDNGKLVNHPMKIIALRRKSGAFTICLDFIDLCQNLRRIQKEKSLNDVASTSIVSESLEPRFTRRQKEKWPETNKFFVTVIVGSLMRRDPQKKPKAFQNKEPRFVRESCRKKPKTKKGSKISTSVRIFENRNEKFKSLSCNTAFCECFNIMHALSNNFHQSSCLVMNHIGTSSRDNKGHFANSGSQKSKPKLKDVVTYLKQANINGPNRRWKKQHVSTWYFDSGFSRHMTGTLELLTSYVNKERSSVAFGGNQKGNIKG
ncbi:hypothetical protein OSB04_024387 [Centaurea solstitialis]|uniref:Uncharacterized protein n=1 Tax=Centaurea solstitialis TaxID=347529 RepID=A0AA38SL07_9ASTR|nr:hypothetical protein OSB04_024387 [Centaurea solstitialis]